MTIWTQIIIGIVILFLFFYHIGVFKAAEVMWKFPKDKTLYKYVLAFGDGLILIEPNDSTPSFRQDLYTNIVSIGRYRLVLLYKWYIPGVGPVPIWCRSHKSIEKLYKAKRRKTKEFLLAEKYSKAFGQRLP